MTKASEIIKQECCGIGLLSIEKAELVKKVELMELQIEILEETLLDKELHKQEAFEARK